MKALVSAVALLSFVLAGAAPAIAYAEDAPAPVHHRHHAHHHHATHAAAHHHHTHHHKKKTA